MKWEGPTSWADCDLWTLRKVCLWWRRSPWWQAGWDCTHGRSRSTKSVLYSMATGTWVADKEGEGEGVGRIMMFDFQRISDLLHKAEGSTTDPETTSETTQGSPPFVLVRFRSSQRWNPSIIKGKTKLKNDYNQITIIQKSIKYNLFASQIIILERYPRKSIHEAEFPIVQNQLAATWLSMIIKRKSQRKKQ